MVYKALDLDCTSGVQEGMHLSDYMAQRGLKDEQVAAGIGRSRVTVSRIRRRKVRPDWPTIEELRKFTDGACTADDFEQLQAAE